MNIVNHDQVEQRNTGVAVGARAVYDAVAAAYDGQFGDELDAKPIDRAVLTALVELVGAGTIADVGCGPGHVTRYLSASHPDIVGIDLSPAMIAIAKARAPELTFTVGSMLCLPATNAAWGGAVALYSIIHLTADERATAFSEFARAIRPHGWLLISFHVDSPDFAAGEVNHLTQWFGHDVSLDGYFLDPDDVANDLACAGFAIGATITREPIPDIEYPSRRSYLISKRRAAS